MPFDQAGFDVGEVVRALTPEEKRYQAALRKIRDGIAIRGGWCKGDLHDGSAHCILGWVDTVVVNGHFGDRWRVLCALYNELPSGAKQRDQGEPDRPTSLMNYNDATRRRRRDMIALVDRAISKLEHV